MNVELLIIAGVIAQEYPSLINIKEAIKWRNTSEQ